MIGQLLIYYILVLAATCISNPVLSSVHCIYCSVVPKPLPKEFIVPLIRKRRECGGGKPGHHYSELERQAAAAILKGD